MGLRGVQLFKREGADWRVQESQALGPSVGLAAERTYVGVEKAAAEVSPEPGGTGRALGLRAGDRPRPTAKCRGGQVTCRVGTEAHLLAALEGKQEELAVLSEQSSYKGCRETGGGLGDLGAGRWRRAVCWRADGQQDPGAWAEGPASAQCLRRSWGAEQAVRGVHAPGGQALLRQTCTERAPRAGSDESPGWGTGSVY